MAAALVGVMSSCDSQQPDPAEARSSSSAVNESRTASTKDSVVVLGPHGVDGLRLGMNGAQVDATGDATARPGSTHDGWRAGCLVLDYTKYQTDVIDGVVSPRAGLERLTAGENMRTPEGVGVGSSLNEVGAAYPGTDPVPSAEVVVRASSTSVYRFQFSPTHVEGLSLELNEQHCVI